MTKTAVFVLAMALPACAVESASQQVREHHLEAADIEQDHVAASATWTDAMDASEPEVADKEFGTVDDRDVNDIEGDLIVFTNAEHAREYHGEVQPVFTTPAPEIGSFVVRSDTHEAVGDAALQELRTAEQEEADYRSIAEQ